MRLERRTREQAAGQAPCWASVEAEAKADLPGGSYRLQPSVSPPTGRRAGAANLLDQSRLEFASDGPPGGGDGRRMLVPLRVKPASDQTQGAIGTDRLLVPAAAWDLEPHPAV